MEAVDRAGETTGRIVGASGKFSVWAFPHYELCPAAGAFAFMNVCAYTFGGLFSILGMLLACGAISDVRCHELVGNLFKRISAYDAGTPFHFNKHSFNARCHLMLIEHYF